MLTSILVTLQGTILVYLIIGALLRKTNMIDDSASSFLSTFLLDFLLPINIFVSCLTSFTKDSLISCISVLFISISCELVIFIVMKRNLKLFDNEQMKVVRYDLLVSNGGLVGTPIVEGLFGASGVVYANVFLIPVRMLAYVAGEGVFNPAKVKGLKDTIIGILKNKIIIAMTIGILMVIFNIQMPTFMFNAFSNIGKCMSPISLILIGSLLVEKFELKKDDYKILYLCIARQFIIPIILILFLKFIPLDRMVKIIAILLMGMPVGSTSAIFAKKYDGDLGFASKAVFISTISSLVTLIVLMRLIEFIL